MNMILEEREKEPFKSFDDLKTRVPLLGDPVELLAKRVVLELDTTQVKRGKKKYYLFTQVPSRHPSNRRKRQNNKNRNRKSIQKHKPKITSISKSKRIYQST